MVRGDVSRCLGGAQDNSKCNGAVKGEEGGDSCAFSVTFPFCGYTRHMTLTDPAPGGAWGFQSWDGLPDPWVEIVDGSTNWERRPNTFGTRVRLLSLDVICWLADDPKEGTGYPLTNPSQVLTISSIVGRSFEFPVRHLSMNPHISAVSPSCSVCGLANLSSPTI